MNLHNYSALDVRLSKREKVFMPKRISFMKQRRHSEIYLLTMIILDIFFLNLSLWGAMWLKIPLEEMLTTHALNIILFFTIANVIAVITASFTEVYQVLEGVRLKLKIKSLFWSTLIYFGLISLVYYEFFFASFGVHILFNASVAFLILATLAHTASRFYQKNHLTTPLSYAIVGGKPSHLKYLESMLINVFGKNITCVGRFAGKQIPGVPNLGGYDKIERFLRESNHINKLLYIDSDLSAEEVRKIGKLCRIRFVDFEIMPRELDYFARGTQLEQFSSLPILRRKKEPLYEFKNRLLKRSFDVFFSLMVILLIFPWLFPLIALLIKLESRGPVFFSQYRSGYWNKPFRCYKFRSMRVNGDSDKKQATKNDSRITKIGAFLRKTNLDELPQFLNVFMGEMSVVGPRPHMLKHTEEYSNLIDTYMIRHEVKPGITGWAQVNGWRGPTDEVYKMEKRVEYDVEYIENWDFWFDCKCILLTVVNMFKGEKNAF